MKSIDLIFLVVLVSLSTLLLIEPKNVRGVLRTVVVFLIVLVLGQLLVEGFHWQYVPSYLLLFVLILKVLYSNPFSNKIRKNLFKIALVLFTFTSIAPFAFFTPIPKLTQPQGKYPLGTKVFRWVDFNRPELITSNPEDKRNVVVQAWYPTVENAKGVHSDYLDGMNNLPHKIGIIPSWVFSNYDRIETNGILNAPVLNEQRKWPVIIFLTGNGASRAFYTSIITGLASHGYIVLALDHPYEAMFTQLSDGRIVTNIEKSLKDDPDMSKFMKARLDLRIADIKFVLSQIGPVQGSDHLLSYLDYSQIAIVGHSLGGATAAVAMATDSRIKAAVNIDGTLYGELPESNISKPFLLIESKKDDNDGFKRYENGNEKFFHLFQGGYRYEIVQADHYSFTDAPLLLGLPARLLLGRFLDFGKIPEKTHTATVDMTKAFISNVLKDSLPNSDLDSIANRYQGIIGKPIKL